MIKLLKIIWFGLPLLLIALFLFWQTKADFKAIDWNNYKGYWSSGKYFITENDKTTKVITFSKIIITGQNCNTTSVTTPICRPNIDLIEKIQKQLENFKNSCISNDDKAIIINMINNINEDGIVTRNETDCKITTKTIQVQTISDVVYITKEKIKYINTFTLAPTGAL